MSLLDEFSEITKADESLAGYTWMKLGGPAQYFVQPRNVDELTRVVQFCAQVEIPMRVIGGGSNVLVRDEGVSGAVIRIVGDEFSRIRVEGNQLIAAGGALLSNAISVSVGEGLAGLETLVGIPGTVGGAVHGNAGGRSGDIGQTVSSVKVLTSSGEQCVRAEDELTFQYRFSSVNELAILECTFDLKHDDVDAITKRMRTLWIMKKASQPLAFQSAGCIFRNPRGLSAGSLIDQAGLKGTRVGGAEISDRHANFIVTSDGCTSDDVHRLIDLVRSRVAEQFGVDLEVEIDIW